MSRLFILGILIATPLSVFASGGELDWKTFGWRVLMFIIFVVLLYVLAANRIKAMLSQRTEDIKQALHEAERAKEEAIKQVQEYEEKMKMLEEELQEMKEVARKVAEQDRENMIAEAQKTVEQMKQFALNTIESETERAINSLRNEVVELALAETEEKLSKEMNESKSVAILTEYIKHIGVASGK